MGDLRKTLDLEREYPFPRYLAQDEWMKYGYTPPAEDDREEIGWGENE